MQKTGYISMDYVSTGKDYVPWGLYSKRVLSQGILSSKKERGRCHSEYKFCCQFGSNMVIMKVDRMQIV